MICFQNRNSVGNKLQLLYERVLFGVFRHVTWSPIIPDLFQGVTETRLSGINPQNTDLKLRIKYITFRTWGTTTTVTLQLDSKEEAWTNSHAQTGCYTTTIACLTTHVFRLTYPHKYMNSRLKFHATAYSFTELSPILTSSIVQVFTCNPQGVLYACFELLQASDADHRKAGQQFLAQIVNSWRKYESSLIDSNLRSTVVTRRMKTLTKAASTLPDLSKESRVSTLIKEQK